MQLALAFLASAAAAFNVARGTAPVIDYVTETVTAMTTYCPYATQLTHNGQTYTVTEATHLTITDCPCTVTRPVQTSSGTYSPTGYVRYQCSSPQDPRA